MINSCERSASRQISTNLWCVLHRDQPLSLVLRTADSAYHLNRYIAVNDTLAQRRLYQLPLIGIVVKMIVFGLLM